MNIDKTFGEKIPNVQYNDREGAYLIVIQKGKAATVRTPKGHFLIGGGIKDGETHIQCIERESLEEIGYHTVVQQYICSAEMYVQHETLGYFHPIQHYYAGELTGKPLASAESDHVFEWISLNEIEEKMFVKAQSWALKYYLSKFVKR